MTTATDPTRSKLDAFVDKYRQEHTHRVNHILHVWVGWPMCALSVLVLPLQPRWSLALFLGGYALMWLGHFVFERNLPTVFKHPSTPFVIALAVIRGLFGSLLQRANRSRPQ
jgi:hypothetical protein